MNDFDDEGGYTCVGADSIWKISATPLNFIVNLKNCSKNIKSWKNHSRKWTGKPKYSKKNGDFFLNPPYEVVSWT